MQGRESDLLYGLLALRMYFLSEPQLVEAAQELHHNPSRDLPGILRSRGWLRDHESEMVNSAVVAHLKRHGDPTEALRRMDIPRPLMNVWRGYKSNPSTQETMVLSPPLRVDPPTVATLLATDGHSSAAAKPDVLTQAPDKKYTLGEELGRGGLGRVVEATDADLDRKVALKLVLEDAPPEALERFRWEAKITGRLEHPHIVPIHEVGVLPATKEVFVAMKRIYGKDLAQVIGAGETKLRKLIEAFRDVCRAMAFAHSKGVIHRDLKPANVMLGDFGEVLIVDWGLARVLGESERRSRVQPRSTTKKVRRTGGGSSKLTMEGQVLGTPSYMPPEQALGWLHEIDERSDVYSLGAILYEILARQPPFEDPNPWEVVKRVTTEEAKPPSIWMPCPPELEAICMKCLRKKKAERYQSAGELASEIDAYLEGTKERERREQLADQQVSKARAELAKWKELEADAKDTAEKARAMAEEVKAHDPLPRKRTLWELQDRAQALSRQSLRAFAEADAALTSALSNAPEHVDARKLKAEAFWARFLEAEDSGDERGAILHRQVVERHDDGSFSERLKGDGTLAVRTRAYPCACLRDGRSVKAADLGVMGYHAWSGRVLNVSGSEGLRGFETQKSLRIRVHAPGCEPAPLEGAKVWAFRYVEMERALVPMTIGASKPKIPDALVDEIFGSSPARPRGGGQFLGTTPIAKRAWPMGSWLLVIHAEGRAPMAVPIAVARQEDLDLDVTLYEPGEMPDGFLPVPAGPFAFQVRKLNVPSPSDRKKSLDDFLMQRFPVTCRDYCEFLNELAATSEKEALRRAPRESDEAGPYWPFVEGEGFVIPTEKWLEKAKAKDRERARRVRSAPNDWEEAWPVMSVSWEDATAFARWASLRAGRLLHLPHEEQWERAARGTDGRLYPWGNYFDALKANCTESHADGIRPVTIDAFPSDESPHGVRQMAGNSRDWCLNEPGGRRYRDWRVARGGMWNAASGATGVIQRFGFVPKYLEPGQGFRLAAAVRLSP